MDIKHHTPSGYNPTAICIVACLPAWFHIQNRKQATPSIIQAETHPDGGLPLLDLAVVNLAPRLHNLEPPHVVDGFVGPGQGGVDRVFDAGARGSGQLDMLVYTIGHGSLLREKPDWCRIEWR